MLATRACCRRKALVKMKSGTSTGSMSRCYRDDTAGVRTRSSGALTTLETDHEAPKPAAARAELKCLAISPAVLPRLSTNKALATGGKLPLRGRPCSRTEETNDATPTEKPLYERTWMHAGEIKMLTPGRAPVLGGLRGSRIRRSWTCFSSLFAMERMHAREFSGGLRSCIRLSEEAENHFAQAPLF